jgi:putative transposase
MEVEPTDHPAMGRIGSRAVGPGTRAAGSTRKRLATEHGPVEIRAPRDRDGSFEPKLVRKRQRRFERFDDKILALYSRGLSTRDIEAHLEEIYGVKVGRDLISRVTDAVMDDARAWQTRPLEDAYPVVELGTLVLKVRDPGSVQRRACYLALAIGMDGEREVLGMWLQATEDAKFWMQVMTELKQTWRQRHPDLLLGRPQGIPRSNRGRVHETVMQTCIVHLIRTSLKYVPRRHYDQVVKDLKPIYTEINSDAAEQPLESFDQKWGARLLVITATPAYRRTPTIALGFSPTSVTVGKSIAFPQGLAIVRSLGPT